MKSIVLCSIFLFLLEVKISEGKAVLVLEVGRHGARSGKYLKEWNWEGYGQLNSLGMRQCFLIGRQINYDYVSTLKESKLLSSTYKEGEIYARSTLVNRTLMSAQAQLLGIYPRVEESLNPKQVKYGEPPLLGDVGDVIADMGSKPLPMNLNLIPVHGIPNEIDAFHWGECPEGLKLSKKDFEDSPQVKEIVDSHMDTVNIVMRELHLPTDNYFDIYSAMSAIHAAVFAEESSGFSKEIEAIAIGMFNSLFPLHYNLQTPDIYKLLGTGPLRECLRMIETALQKQRNHTEYEVTPKFMLVSTHDSTLTPMLAILGHVLTQGMPFAANLQIVLHSTGDHLRGDDDLILTLIYNGEKLDVCGEECTYKQFKDKMEQILMPEDQRIKECKGEEITSGREQEHPATRLRGIDH